MHAGPGDTGLIFWGIDDSVPAIVGNGLDWSPPGAGWYNTPMNDGDQKIGVMGCGVVAGYGHLPALRDVDGVGPWALYDPNQSAVRGLAERYDIPAERAFTDEASFFASGLDAVLVSSPAPVHEANVVAAAGHGLPILCEKPLATDQEQGERMIAACAAAKGGEGVALYVAFCYRFSPAALRIKQLIDDGTIGSLRSLRLIYNWDCHGKYLDRDPAQGLAPHRDGRMREGGPMVDCGTHQIDLAQWWAGSPVHTVKGFGAWADDYEAPDHCWCSSPTPTARTPASR